MKLSIVIVSFNTERILEKCLQSIFKEGKNLADEFEILVVDNASSDASVAMIEKKFPQIKLIRNKENLGFSKAVNQGLKQAKGETALLLNSDTYLTENCLKKLLSFEQAVRPAIIGARLLNPDGTVQPSVFKLPTVGRAIQEYWLGKKGYFSKYAPPGNSPVEVEAIVGGVMLISREILNRIGLLDERYFMYFEDLDYCRRVRQKGFKVYYLPEAEIIHEHGASGKTISSAGNQWRRLIPSSKIYHGILNHFAITFIIWSSQKVNILSKFRHKE